MKSNILTWVLPFILGMALSAFVMGGLTKAKVEEAAPVSLSPVMDRLNAYSCRKAETKHLVMGGIEDGFSPAGDENIDAQELLEFYKNQTGSSGGISLGRNYDGGGYDQIFLDSFRLPENTAHGIFIMRLKQLGTMNNDSISLGALKDAEEKAHQGYFNYANPSQAQGLTIERGIFGEILSGEFETIKFRDRFQDDGSPFPREYDNLLDFVRTSGQSIDIFVSDDTMVDVIGFAACTEPKPGLGTTFLVRPFEDNFVLAQCNRFDREDHCQRYSGDTSCSTALPLSCFADTQTPLPPSLLESQNNFKWGWSGGKVQFTAPLRGDRFQNQAEVHAYCAESFGPDYRAANIHDGSQSTGFIAEGEAGNVTQAWVDSNLEPYGNCWSMTPDYEEAAHNE